MRKFNYTIALVLSFGLYGYSVTPATAAITGTAHDLSGGAGQVCVTCHTPHNAQATANQLIPLWNHATTATATYTVYASPTSSIDGVISQPSGVSKACLSCHDGTVATDAYGGTFDPAGGTPAKKLSGGKNLGTDLSNDHPVSVTYVDPELVPIASIPAGGVELFGTAGNETVECASCHDVHDNTLGKFMRVTTVGSALCKSCHAK